MSTPLQNHQLQAPGVAADDWHAWAESLVASHLFFYHDARYEKALADESSSLRLVGMVTIGIKRNESIALLHQFRAQEYDA